MLSMEEIKIRLLGCTANWKSNAFDKKVSLKEAVKFRVGFLKLGKASYIHLQIHYAVSSHHLHAFQRRKGFTITQGSFYM